MRSSQDPYLAVLALQITPLINPSPPPTQLMGRRLRTTLPQIDHQYQNKRKDPSSSSACKSPEIKSEDSVCVLSDKK